MNGARGVIINVTGGPDLSLVEVSDASTIVQEAADEDANIIFGAVVDPALKGKVKITVIATGFGAAGVRAAGGVAGADAGRHDATTPITRAMRADAGAAASRRPRSRTVDRPPAAARSADGRRLPELAACPAAGAIGVSRRRTRCDGRRRQPSWRTEPDADRQLDVRRAGVPAPPGGLSASARRAQARRRSPVVE